eukprot:3527266-Rhodomonas_salina.1
MSQRFLVLRETTLVPDVPRAVPGWNRCVVLRESILVPVSGTEPATSGTASGHGGTDVWYGGTNAWY